MKKLKYTGLVVLAVTLFACGNAATEETESTSVETAVESTENNYEGMEMVDLNGYDIPASIYIADGSKGKPDFRTTGWESLEIEVGKNFGIEIIPFGLTVAEKRTELEGDLVYEIEYLEEAPDKIVYRKTIKDSEVEPEVHFFFNKDLNGDNYTVKSLNKPYNKREIENMMIAAKSLSAKDPA